MIWIIAFLTIVTLLSLNRALSRLSLKPIRTKYEYDAIIVGGSIAGPVMAKALAAQNRKVLLLERSLFKKPDRIVGELLQPGGINALKELDMMECASSVGMPCFGYVVVDQRGEQVDLPYKEGSQGYSFHFGDFVNNMRKHVWYECSQNVTLLEATVNEVLLEGSSCLRRAYGVEYTIAADYKQPEHPFHTSPVEPTNDGAKVRQVATAPLIIMCDGGASKFKAKFEHYTPATKFHSNFVALIAKNVQLPKEQWGTVFLGKTGPILSYRLDPGEIRFFVDYNKPTLPNLELQSRWLIEEIAPCLPEHMRSALISTAKDIGSIRSMPIAHYSPTFPSIKGYVGIGDHGNQRHPLTGGGMTCAMNDALLLAKELRAIPNLRSDDANEMSEVEDMLQRGIVNYSRARYQHSSCINSLSWALYAVFSIPILRNACFDYFVRGGDCVAGLMALVSGLDWSLLHLIRHYYAMMFYGAINIITESGLYSCREGKQQPDFTQKCMNALGVFLKPQRLWNAIYLLIRSTMVVLPVAYFEFVSFWRLMDPTSFLSNLARNGKVIVYRTFLDAKNWKPIGI